MFLGDASFVGVIDGLFVLGSEFGFGPCCALVLCPSDVIVEDNVVCQLDLSSLLASSKAFKCLALVLARDTSGANSIVVGGGSGGSGGRGGWFASGWICSIFGKR